jgi:hypothetical protein
VTKLRAEGFEILGGVQTFRHSTHSWQVLKLSTWKPSELITDWDLNCIGPEAQKNAPPCFALQKLLCC